MCQITFKVTLEVYPGSKNIFYDVESCKKDCLTDKHSYDELPQTKKYVVPTIMPTTEIKKGLVFIEILSADFILVFLKTYLFLMS